MGYSSGMGDLKPAASRLPERVLLVMALLTGFIALMLETRCTGDARKARTEVTCVRSCDASSAACFYDVMKNQGTDGLQESQDMGRCYHQFYLCANSCSSPEIGSETDE